jgi:RNA polymerase sigma-70 factor (ECF subfamily)
MTQEVFLSLLLPIQDRLFRTAYRLLLNEEEAKDIVQDVFIKLWNRRHELEKCKSVEAWCITVTKNAALDRMKSKKYRNTEIMSVVQKGRNNIVDTSVETKDAMDITRRIINSLPEKQRLLIHLRDVEGFAYEVIAEIMQLTIGEVKIGLFRARKKIREELTKIDSYGLQ